MKRKDISTVVVIVVIAALISFFLANAIFNKSRTKKEQVEVVQAINSEFPTPDKKFFNSDSINPTQIITVGRGNNSKPF